MSAGTFQLLPIESIELDQTNPRIRRFLEFQAGPITKDHIALALDVENVGEGSHGSTTPEKLRSSIRAYGGLTQPIIVNRHADGTLRCIEGNTRLYIYQRFAQEGVQGDWTKIPAMVHEVLSAPEIDAIRLQAHLVGPRPWDAYSKAKYLWELANKEMMPIDRIVSFCGGNRRDVTLAIQAYSDMEAYYRPACDDVDADFDHLQYSGFVELQTPRVREAIIATSHTLVDFACWLRDGKFSNLQQVRHLHTILRDKKARDVFLKKGAKAALNVIERPELSAGVKGATLVQLARGLTEAISRLEYAEFKRMKSNADDETARYLVEALEALQDLQQELGAP